MNKVLQTSDCLLLSLGRDELKGISNALNEVCNGVHIDDSEFRTRLGVTRAFLQSILTQLNSKAIEAYQRADVWNDNGAVQVICVTVFGDPVDMSADHAKAMVDKIQSCLSN
ncbi:MAG: hypothetical protein JNJ77_21345 [Planctomycetia bacterium]|nr:hypothetical protein [Planctomycetia bacterium]